MTHSFQKWSEGRGGGGPGGEVGGCLPRGSCMVRIFRNVSQRWSFKKEFRMHCYAFIMLYLKDGPLRRSSECIAMLFVMLYLKDGPLRRSSEYIAMLFIMLYLKDGPLRSSECIGLFLCWMYALKYFAGNIECQGGEGGGGEWGVG